MTLSDIPTVIYYNPSGEILAWVLGTSPSWVIDTESHGLATVAQRCTYFEFAEEKDSQSPLRSCLNSLKMETVRPDATLRRRRGKSRNMDTTTHKHVMDTICSRYIKLVEKNVSNGPMVAEVPKIFSWLNIHLNPSDIWYRVRVHHTRDYPSTMWLCPVHRLGRVMDDFHDSQTRVRHISDPRLRVQSSLSFFSCYVLV